MKELTVLLCSHRTGGTSQKLAEIFKGYKDFNIEIVSFDKVKLEACIMCNRCSGTGGCVRYKEDDFNGILEKLKSSRTILVISPLYALIPSKLAAFLDRLTSITYFSQMRNADDIPLHGKKCGVICYDSSKRNKNLECIIKNVLKPNIEGFADIKCTNDFDFIEDVQCETTDIVSYVKVYLEKNHDEIFKKTF